MDVSIDVDSFDVSQLKAEALGFEAENASSHGNPQASDVLCASGNGEPADPMAMLSRPTSRRESSENLGRPPDQHLSVSQLSPPSTIHNSMKSKDVSSGSMKSVNTEPYSNMFYETYMRNKFVKDNEQSRDTKGLLESAAPVNYTSGQTGDVDLLGVLQQPETNPASQQERHYETVDGDGPGAVSQVDVQVELSPTEQQPHLPGTPTTHKRGNDHDGKMAEHDLHTPRLPVNPFAHQDQGDGGVMSLTQVFKATQAPSSPFPGVLPSEATSGMPSPNMWNLPRPSSVQPLSSPPKLERTTIHRSSAEPQTTYISMRDSQEERDRRRRLLNSSPVCRGQPEDQSEEEISAELGQVLRRIRERDAEQKAMQHLDKIRAMPRPGPTGRGRGRGRGRGHGHGRASRIPHQRHSSPDLGRSTGNALVVSDDLGPDLFSDDTTEEETEHEDDAEVLEAESVDELADENKENVDERAVQVPMTIARSTSRVYKAQPRSSPSPLQGTAPPEDSDTDELVGGMRAEPAIDSSPRRQRGQPIVPGTQTMAMADPHAPPGDRIRLPLSPSGPRTAVQLSQVRKPLSSSQIDSSMARGILAPPSQQTISPPPSSPAVPANGSNIESMSSQKARELVRSGSVDNYGDEEDELGSSPPVVRDKRRGRAGRPNAYMDKRLAGSEDMLEPEAVQQKSSKTMKGLESLVATTRGPKAMTVSVDEPTHRHSSVSEYTENLKPMPSSKHYRPGSGHPSLYSTAQTHHGTSPSTSQAQGIRKASASVSPTKVKPRRARAFMDIAADPSPPDDVDDIDVDINLMTPADLEFQAHMASVDENSSPIGRARKRRRINGGRALEVYRLEKSLITSRPPIPSSPERLDQPDKPVVIEDDLSARSPRVSAQVRTVNTVKRLHSVSVPRRETLVPLETPILSTPSGTTTNSLRGVGNATASLQTPSDTGTGPAIRSPVLAPHRVFALWNGNPKGFFPATCLGGPQAQQYHVRFDDGTEDRVGMNGVRRLELQAGDIVKIDRPKLRGNSYIVQELLDKQSPTSSGDCVGDVYGHVKVKVAPKLKNGQAASAPETLPIASVYLTTTLFYSTLRNRPYPQSLPAPTTCTSGPEIPSSRPSIPSTPPTHAARTSKPFLRKEAGAGLFANMAFALTSIADPARRAKTAALVVKHGGTLLNDGFEPLFDTPGPLPTPAASDPPTFRLTAAASALGFTALLSDTHCRSTKYLHALALNVPCLATRWAHDCAAKAALVDWRPYLLPSGESRFLDGAIRSRVLEPPAPGPAPRRRTDWPLASMVASRPALLRGAAVLVLVPDAAAAAAAAYPFIAYALGAARVAVASAWKKKAGGGGGGGGGGGAPDDTGRWDWICAYEEGARDKGRKRKRRRGDGDDNDDDGLEVIRREDGARVVGTEFLVQSLLLGRLVSGD